MGYQCASCHITLIYYLNVCMILWCQTELPCGLCMPLTLTGELLLALGKIEAMLLFVIIWRCDDRKMWLNCLVCRHAVILHCVHVTVLHGYILY